MPSPGDSGSPRICLDVPPMLHRFSPSSLQQSLGIHFHRPKHHCPSSSSLHSSFTFTQPQQVPLLLIQSRPQILGPPPIRPLSVFLDLTVTRFSFSSHPASAPMDTSGSTSEKIVYSVWALPPEDLAPRLRKLMDGLRSEFGGPQFEPHVTVVGAISLSQDDALKKFEAACAGLKAYTATVDRVATGTFFYQCVYLPLQPTAEVVKASDHCSAHLGYKRPTPYMPHLSLLYGDLSDEEKKKAQEKASALDDNLNGLSFQISRLALYKTDTEDKTCKSWEKVRECTLITT